MRQLNKLAEIWSLKDEYSHGPMIPMIVAFLVWQKKDSIELVEFRGSWLGILLLLIALCIFFLAELGGIYTLIQYSFLLAFYGVVLAFVGTRAFRIILVPMLMLSPYGWWTVSGPSLSLLMQALAASKN